jgi:hypothetical protein
MTKRSLIPLLIGIIGSIVGFTAVALLRQNRCADAGGKWDTSAGACALATGPINVNRASDLLAGLVVALMLGVVLHRAATFATRNRAR